MSWSKNTSGTRAIVLAALALMAAEVEATDQKYGASEPITALHKAQAERAVASATQFVENAPEDYGFSLTLSGHGSVNGDGETTSDQWSVSLSTYKPAAVAAGSASTS